ncbi:MAG: ABC transporter substrate-binding protein [Myxococcales bacterium]|nr:ABC transporter substrate-binding protein [Myxococcales bacterium]
MRFPRSIFAGLFSLALLAPDAASAGILKDGPSASETFKTRHEAVIKLVKERADAAKIQTEVDNLLDYHALAETSLGGPLRFQNRCAPRCDEFEALLTKLIRENYLKRIRTDKEYELAYGDETRGPRHTRVSTTIKHTKDGKEELVEVVYVMHRADENKEWKVEDIITEGVSLAKNYKYEFNKILKENGDKGIDELILRLERKLAELAKKD